MEMTLSLPLSTGEMGIYRVLKVFSFMAIEKAVS